MAGVRTKLECDFCSADVQSMTVFEHGAFNIMTSVGSLYSQQAGYMGACDLCKPLVEALDLRGLRERAISAGLWSETARHLHAQVLKHLTGLTFESKVGEADTAPRFFVHRCLRCSHETRIDGESYDEFLRFKCAACGCDITLISRAPGVIPARS